MSGSWLDIQAENGTQRVLLRDGLTRLGGAGADYPLGAAGSDQLHCWNRPPRALFVGTGERPRKDGRPFEETRLVPGDRIEWAGVVLVYGSEALPEDLASVEELPRGEPGAPSDLCERAGRRVLAGLACELGLADARTARTWQQAVLEERFDPDRAAGELLPQVLALEVERRLLERSGTLLRDLLMAPLLSGVRGQRRRLRAAARSGLAFLVAQVLALLALALILAAGMLVLRSKGVSFDGLLDRALPG